MALFKFLLLSTILQLAATDLIPFDDWLYQRVALPDVNIYFRYAGTGPPVLLVHGYPEHSLTWHTIGPILAQNYTVIAVDIRGMGQSTIPNSYDFTSATASEDLKGVLDFLNINQTYLVAHDKGNGQSAALNVKYRSLVKRAVYTEYALPGFGYERVVSPELGVTGLYQNWQLAFFSVPDAAQYFIQGQEKQMLAWYFWHASYSGNSVISQDYLDRYTREISKPGYLRSGLEYFNTTQQDAVFFNTTLGVQPLENPALVLGGEADLAPVALLEQFWGPILKNPTYDIVPKAGHWLGDENPEWTANRLLSFFAEDEGIPSIDLSYLKDKVTLV